MTRTSRNVVLMGDYTDICVLYGAFDLRMRGYAVEVPAAAVTSFDKAQHEWALGHMQKVLGVQVT